MRSGSSCFGFWLHYISIVFSNNVLRNLCEKCRHKWSWKCAGRFSTSPPRYHTTSPAIIKPLPKQKCILFPITSWCSLHTLCRFCCCIRFPSAPAYSGNCCKYFLALCNASMVPSDLFSNVRMNCITSLLFAGR